MQPTDLSVYWRNLTYSHLTEVELGKSIWGPKHRGKLSVSEAQFPRGIQEVGKSKCHHVERQQKSEITGWIMSNDKPERVLNSNWCATWDKALKNNSKGW
jgi:hypothetical protein